MSRRDTIIVAVLLNASLLAILFVMAINTDTDKPTQPQEVAMVDMPIHSIQTTQSSLGADPITLAVINPAQQIDEIDTVLKDYAVPSQSIVTDEDSNDEQMKRESQIIAATQSPQTEPSNLQYVQVTVKKGDSLDKIARANGTNVVALKKVNNLKTDSLKVGQVLNVPASSQPKKSHTTQPIADASKPAATKANDGEHQYYTVQKGDNPWKIAKQFHVKFDDLLKLNNLDEERARNLKIGDKIRVK